MCKGPATQGAWQGDSFCAPPIAIQPSWHQRANSPSTAKRFLSNYNTWHTLFIDTFCSLYVHYLRNFPDFHDLGISDFLLPTTVLFTSTLSVFITFQDLKLRLYCSMYLSCLCLLTFLFMAFMLDCLFNTHPTVLLLRTVADVCLLVSSEFYYSLPHCLAMFSIRLHHSYCTWGFPFEISSKTSNLPFVSPLRYSAFKRIQYILCNWFIKHAFAFVSQSFVSDINNIFPPSPAFNNSLFSLGFITILLIAFASHSQHSDFVFIHLSTFLNRMPESRRTKLFSLLAILVF